MTKTMRTLTKTTSVLALTIVMTLGAAAVVYANPSSRLEEARQRHYEQRQLALERVEEARARNRFYSFQINPAQPSHPAQGQLRPAVPAAPNQPQTDRPGRAMPTNVTLNGTTLHIYEMTGVNILENTAPIFLTNEQLVVLAEKAPCPTETRSRIVLPERRLTEQEINAWIAEYWMLGGFNSGELNVIRLINVERANVGLAPVAINPIIMMAARYKSQEIDDLNHLYPLRESGVRMAHSSPVYGDFHHIPYEIFGVNVINENLMAGVVTSSATGLGWMNSDGHRANVLSNAMESVGVGVTARFEHPDFYSNPFINASHGIGFTTMMGG